MNFLFKKNKDFDKFKLNLFDNLEYEHEAFIHQTEYKQHEDLNTLTKNSQEETSLRNIIDLPNNSSNTYCVNLTLLMRCLITICFCLFLSWIFYVKRKEIHVQTKSEAQNQQVTSLETKLQSEIQSRHDLQHFYETSILKLENKVKKVRNFYQESLWLEKRSRQAKERLRTDHLQLDINEKQIIIETLTSEKNLLKQHLLREKGNLISQREHYEKSITEEKNFSREKDSEFRNLQGKNQFLRNENKNLAACSTMLRDQISQTVFPSWYNNQSLSQQPSACDTHSCSKDASDL